MKFKTPSPEDIDYSWSMINYPVGIPSHGILSVRTWQQLDQELETRYRRQGQLTPNRISTGCDKECAHTEVFNKLWPQYPNFMYYGNSLGFRGTQEPLEQVDHCYYGCSMTYGEGVPFEGIWSNRLDQLLGTTSNNFGIGGSSVEESMLMFLATSRLVKMKRAVFLFPDYHRKTVCISRRENVRDCIYWNLLGVENWKNRPDIDPYLRNLRDAHGAHFRHPGVHHMDFFRTVVQHIQYVAELRGIEVVMGTWNENSAQMLRHMKDTDPSLKISNWTPMVDAGRDDCHPGILTHARWAEEFAKVI